MTHIVIHNRSEVLEEYLLSLISSILKREISKPELSKIPDIHMLNFEGPSIGIDDIKALQKEMIYKPFELEYQIAVIQNSHLLTHEAQNAFLKTLEDSPDFTVYILLLNNEKNLLNTILSRGIKHYVRGGEEEAKEITKPEILDLDLVDQFLKIEELAKEKNDDISNMLKDISIFLREELRNGIMKGNDVSNSMRKVEIVNTAISRLNANGNRRLVLENMFIQLES